MSGASGRGSVSQTLQLSLNSSALCNQLAQNWTFILRAHKLCLTAHNSTSGHVWLLDLLADLCSLFCRVTLIDFMGVYLRKTRMTPAEKHLMYILFFKFLFLCFMFGSSLPASVCWPRFDHLPVSLCSFFFFYTLSFKHFFFFNAQCTLLLWAEWLHSDWSVCTWTAAILEQ